MQDEKNPYEILGLDGISALVNAFYDIMDADPEFAPLRKMHAPDLTPMRGKLTEYLTGWLGGPPVYLQKYGTICMTEPHAPYAIGYEERDQWLACMYKALDQINASDELKDMLREPLFLVADAVRNREHASPHKKDPNIIATGCG
jgi:hemoglobin